MIHCNRQCYIFSASSWSYTSKETKETLFHYKIHFLNWNPLKYVSTTLSISTGTVFCWRDWFDSYYSEVIMSTMVSHISSTFIVYSTLCSGTDPWKHQSSTPLTFLRGIHRLFVNSPHKGPVTRKMFPFDDVTMIGGQWIEIWLLSLWWGWRNSSRVIAFVIICRITPFNIALMRYNIGLSF